MEIRLIGSSVPDASRRQFVSSYVINGTVGIDVGCTGFYGSPQEQEVIRDIFLTHSHTDQIATLPIFVENAWTPTDDCPTTHAVSRRLKQCRSTSSTTSCGRTSSPSHAAYLRLGEGHAFHGELLKLGINIGETTRVSIWCAAENHLRRPGEHSWIIISRAWFNKRNLKRHLQAYIEYVTDHEPHLAAKSLS
jgi:ribonuclease BN (tRNA processing enzyme)